MIDPVALLLDHLEGVRRSGAGWMARCPGHEDGHASLSIAAGDDGRALVACHAGCTPQAVVGALGLGMADLYRHTDGAAGPERPARGRGHETRYRIRLADGSLAGERIEHVRLDRTDGPKRMWWERDGRRNLRGLSTSAFGLYGMHELTASGADSVVLVEGEKAVDALRRGGFVAVGTVTGAGAIPDRDALTPLSGLRVILWPDADSAGMGHMQRIAAELEKIAASVIWVTPPEDAPAGWDAADASAEVIRRLIAGARPAADTLAGSIPEQLIVPPTTAPMLVARKLVADLFTGADGVMVIREWRGGYCAWDGRCWPERDVATIRAGAYRYLEHALYEVETPLGTELRRWEPTKAKIANVLEALAAVTHLPATVQPPMWLDGEEELPEAKDLVVTANGILHVPDRRLLPHDARLFVGHSVPFAYDPAAPAPGRWLAFLDELWADDADSIALLQEMFGYALWGDTSLQKIMLLVGPPRAGKGVIARVLTRLLGRHNVGAPTLAGLTTNFGLQDLIGKTLAIVSDARLGPRANVQALAERLLSISGEDSITIDRKYKDPWTGPLGVRFLLLTNELPRFTDASGALAKRFVVLVLSRTFYGREDPGLVNELLPELPAIMNWALDGLDGLRARQRFIEPASAREAIRELEDLSSPMSAFLRDRCIVARDMRVSVDELWAAWKAWAEDQSLHHGTKQTFGRDLRAAVPSLHVSRPREGDHRRAYIGVGLEARANDPLDRGPRGPARTDDASGPHGPRTRPSFSQPDGDRGLVPHPDLPANDDGWPAEGPSLSWEALGWAAPGGPT